MLVSRCECSQVVNHGIDPALRARAEEQQRVLFGLPEPVKETMRRTAGNSRGWYNDELTKQRRDWKEGLDFGAVPSDSWALRDDDPANGNMDGFNRFPPAELAPDFRPTILACVHRRARSRLPVQQSRSGTCPL